MRKGYADLDTGQVHYRVWNDSAAGTPVMCLHPAPHSGAWFETLAPLIAQSGRPVLAPDYPGFGGSDRPNAPPQISDYAQSMCKLIDALDLPKLHLLGFHTGCLVALDMARQCQSNAIGQLGLIDVPYIETAQRKSLLSTFAPDPAQFDWDDLKPLWDKAIVSRAEKVSFERNYDVFCEQLRAHRYGHWAYLAAYAYPCEEQFGSSTASGKIIATQSILREPTQAASKVLSKFEFSDRPDITSPALEIAAQSIADELGPVWQRG